MIGLSSLSLDSYILIKDAAGIAIENLLLLVWTKNTFAFGNLPEFQSKLRESKRGSQVLIDLVFKQWDNEIIKMEFYNDAVVIADTQQLSVWNQKILSSANVQNLKTIALNPEFKPHICATLSKNGQVSFYDLKDMSKVDLPCENVSCVTWSKKGKQIACGTKTGEILFYDTGLELKKKISRPEKLSDSFKVQFIEWIEVRSFLVIYVSQDNETCVYQILEHKETKQQTFMELDDPACSFGGDRDPFYFCQVLKSWDFDNLLILANSASTDVGLIGSSVDSSELENWEALEAYQFTMPLDEEQEDTWPISTALDLYSDSPLPSLTPDQPPIPACPILWILNNKGMLMACDVLSTRSLEKGVAYPSMLKGASKPLTLSVAVAPTGKTAPSVFASNKEPSVIDKPKLTPAVTDQSKEKAYDFSTVAKPSSITPNPTNNRTFTFDKKPDLKNDSNATSKSLSILVGQFNKAYQDFQFDLSRLSKFSTELNLLAQSQETSSLSDIPSTISNVQTLEQKLYLINDSLLKTEERFEDVKSQLLHSWAKKEESQRLLTILKSPDKTGKEKNTTSLGPEAEELKKLLNRKKKKIESSIADLNEVLEDLRDRADAQKRGKKILGTSQNWYTLCKTVQRITNSAIEANVALDDLEKKMNQMSVPTSKQSQNKEKENHSPSKSPYGLIKVEDVLAEDLRADLKTESTGSNLFALLMSNSYTPSITNCTWKRPNFRANIIVHSPSIGSAAPKGTVADDVKREGQNGTVQLEKNRTLAEKIDKLDSTPPAKNEYIKPSPNLKPGLSKKSEPSEVKPDFTFTGFTSPMPKKVEPTGFNNEFIKTSSNLNTDAPKLGSKNESEPSETKPAFTFKGFVSPMPKKTETSVQPSFSGTKPHDTGANLFGSSSPKVNFSGTIGSPILSKDSKPSEAKVTFDAKDNSDNPFLVSTKIPASPFGASGFKIPEPPKHVVPPTKAPLFTFPSVASASGDTSEKKDIPVGGASGFKIPEPPKHVAPPTKAPIFTFPSVASAGGETSEKKDIPTLPKLDSKTTDGKDVQLQNIKDAKPVDDDNNSTPAENSNVEDEIDSESSNESERTGELVNEDDDENSSESILPKDDAEKAPNLDSLDFLGSSKPKNIVNPIFALNDEKPNKDAASKEDKVKDESSKILLKDISKSSPKNAVNSSVSNEVKTDSAQYSVKSNDDLGSEAMLVNSSTDETPASQSKVAQSTSDFAPSVFGHPSTNIFGKAPENNVTAFGQASIMSGTVPVPAFNQSIAFGTQKPIPSAAPTFGQSTTFGTAAQPAAPFGQPTVFGTPTTLGQGSAGFGSQSSGFGTPNKNGQSTTAFSQSTPPHPFGQSNNSFVQSTPVFGQSASGFGQTTPVFGQSPAFGNTGSTAESVNTSGGAPTGQGFGSFSKTAFGQSSVGFGSGSNSNSFAALSGVSSPSPAPSSFAGISQGGFTAGQGFNGPPAPSTGPLGPGQSLAGNVAFGTRSGIGSNAPAFGLSQPSFPNISGSQGVFGSSVGTGNTTTAFGGGAPSAQSGFAAFSTNAAPAASFASFGSSQNSGFGSVSQPQQNNSIFGSSSQSSNGFGNGSFSSGFGQNPNNSAFSHHRG